MKFEDYKLEFSIIYIITTIIIGVIFWFILDLLAIINSIEIAAITSISLIMVLIVYLLHGKGLLPNPNNSLYVKNRKYNYKRKIFHKQSFSRERYLDFIVKRKKFQKYHK